MNWLYKTKNIILDILFPPLCLACDSYLEGLSKEIFLCKKCFDSIPLYDTIVCPVCGSRFAENKKICHQNIPFRLAAAGRYDDPVIKKLIHSLKYKSLGAAAAPLGFILTEYLKHLPFNLSNYVILPIPLHKNRERKRGFNQSELIAGKVADYLKLPLVTNAIIRHKNNLPQAEMPNLKSREKNIAGVFKIKNPELIRGRNVLIVDDVFTTGATMREAVATLRIGGAKLAIALVVALAR